MKNSRSYCLIKIYIEMNTEWLLKSWLSTKKYSTAKVGLADNHLQSISSVRQNEIHPYRQAIEHPYQTSTAHHNANDISYITRSKANINLIILQKM